MALLSKFFCDSGGGGFLSGDCVNYSVICACPISDSTVRADVLLLRAPSSQKERKKVP